MADIIRYPLLRRFRAEPTMHALRFRAGKLVAEGRGLAFLFRPTTTGIAEVPIDDRDVTFLFRTRTADFQQLVVQGVLTWRAQDPGLLADRVDFTVDIMTGDWREDPLAQVGGLLTQLAQQAALDLVATIDLRDAVRTGLDRVRAATTAALAEDPRIADLGLHVVAVRVEAVTPDAEMEQALRTPIQEAVQQQADEARFGRRAMAVDKERAIAENELANRLELAKREEDLITQQGVNRQREVEDQARLDQLEVEAQLQRAGLQGDAARTEQEKATTAHLERLRLEADATAARTVVTADAQAAATRTAGGAAADAAEAMMEVNRDTPVEILIGIALQEFAANIGRIEHLNLAPDQIGPLLTTLMGATTRHLEAAEADA